MGRSGNPAVAAQQAATAPVRTLTETFLADASDKALIAELVHRLGYEPNMVGELHVTVPAGRMQVAVTHRGRTQVRR